MEEGGGAGSAAGSDYTFLSCYELQVGYLPEQQQHSILCGKFLQLDVAIVDSYFYCGAFLHISFPTH